MSQDKVEMIAELIAQTHSALLISDGDIEVWLPKSQIEYSEGLDDTVELVIPELLAKEKELI